MHGRARRAVAALVLTLAVGCAGDQPAAGPPTAPPAMATEPEGPLEPSEPFGLTTVTLRSPDGSTALPIHVYDAWTPRARRRGLMGREHLPEHTGMVFRLPRPAARGFWMRNTLIPLSIAFFDGDGEVLVTLDMQPCEADPCPTYEPGTEYQGALEVNQGMFDDIGLAPGWHVELPVGLPRAR